MKNAIRNGDIVEFTMGPGHPTLPQGGTVRGVVIDAGTCARYPRNPTIMVRGLGQVEVLREKLHKVPCLFIGDTL